LFELTAKRCIRAGSEGAVSVLFSSLCDRGVGMNVKIYPGPKNLDAGYDTGRKFLGLAEKIRIF